MDLDPVLEELFKDKNSTGEEVKVLPVKLTRKFFAWHLNCHSCYFHICEEYRDSSFFFVFLVSTALGTCLRRQAAGSD